MLYLTLIFKQLRNQIGLCTVFENYNKKKNLYITLLRGSFTIRLFRRGTADLIQIASKYAGNIIVIIFQMLNISCFNSPDGMLAAEDK